MQAIQRMQAKPAIWDMVGSPYGRDCPHSPARRAERVSEGSGYRPPMLVGTGAAAGLEREVVAFPRATTEAFDVPEVAFPYDAGSRSEHGDLRVGQEKKQRPGLAATTAVENSRTSCPQVVGEKCRDQAILALNERFSAALSFSYAATSFSTADWVCLRPVALGKSALGKQTASTRLTARSAALSRCV